MFSFLNMPFDELELPGLNLSVLDIPLPMEKFEMSLSAGEQEGRIQGSLSYRTSLFAESNLRRLLNHFENLLVEIVSAPGKHVGEFAILGEADLQLLQLWNHAQA